MIAASEKQVVERAGIMSLYEAELEKVRELFAQGLYEPAFYKKKLRGRAQLENYETFRQIPFTYKWEIRNSSVEERTTTRMEDIYGIFSSSGTTGEKTYYIYSKKDKMVHEEFVRTFYTELGIQASDLGGVMAPVETGVMAHSMMWQFTTMGAGYVNCPSPSPENMIDIVTKTPVTVIATRPSIASSVAYNPIMRRMARASGVRKLLMGGGFLSRERRKLLEDAWDADCYNMFGMSEVFGPMAGECRRKDGLHYLNEYLMIEIVNPETGEPMEPGAPGVAVYTTLWKKGFPLLRYWTEDLMILTQEPCACGSALPRLYYMGRLNDCFRINGNYIFPENVENILFKYGNIGEYRVEKLKDAYIVKTESGDATPNPKMTEELNRLFGADVVVEPVNPGSLNYDGHAKRFAEV